MATISLDANDLPVEAAYSNHFGGVRRPWAETPRAGDSPLLYVGRGSHAGYFRFASGGHPLVGELSRSEEHTSELQSLMRISYAVLCLKKKKTQHSHQQN